MTVPALALAPPLALPVGPCIESPRRVASAVEEGSEDREETRLLSALRAGDERALSEFGARFHGSLKRVARSFGASEAVAEEIVQETWLAVLEGLDGFEGRSSFRGWLFGILKNQARRRAARERRSVPFSSLAGDDEPGEPVVPSERFQGVDGCWPNHWAAAPRPWEDGPQRLASLEAREQLRGAIAGLPPRQRVVIALRDVEGLTSDEVCEVLEISEGNQRVLLHRGRVAVRNVLEEYVNG